VKKKIWGNLQKIIELSTQKIVIRLSKIYGWDPGSRKTYSGSRIQGLKRHQLPDPDPQHYTYDSLKLAQRIYPEVRKLMTPKRA
jgi:hypothetical protein